MNFSVCILIRDDREWLFKFPLPLIPMQSIPIPSHSHSQFCHQFPFPWDSHKAFPIPCHSHSRTLHRCSINYFWAREDSSLNMPLKLTISCVDFIVQKPEKCGWEYYKFWSLICVENHRYGFSVKVVTRSRTLKSAYCYAETASCLSCPG